MAEKKEFIQIKTDLEWGSTWYLKVDPYQLEYILTGLTLRPGKGIMFVLSHKGEEREVYDFECSPERDELKYVENKNLSEDD